MMTISLLRGNNQLNLRNRSVLGVTRGRLLVSDAFAIAVMELGE